VTDRQQPAMRGVSVLAVGLAGLASLEAFQSTRPTQLRGGRRREVPVSRSASSSSSPEEPSSSPEPLFGEDSLPEIRWLPPLNPARGRNVKPSKAPGTMVLPIFPLGAVAYTPGSTQVLNIFEKRYRQMYSDILMSGGRRFVTTMVNPDAESELAEVGVVFYLEDLKEVSQQTNDAIKYVVQHKVLDKRVSIHTVLNPGDSVTRETYMRAEVSELEDVDEDADTAALETAVVSALTEVAEMQDQGNEDVRFLRASVANLSAARGVGEGSLWTVVELWKNFLDARAQAAGRKVQAEVQARLVKYLSEKTGQRDLTQLPNTINLSDLPADLQRDVKNLRERVLRDVAPLVQEQTRGVQRLLQADSHAQRLRLFLTMVDGEKRRLIARRTLKATLSAIAAQKRPSDQNATDTSSSSSSSSSSDDPPPSS